MSKVNEPDNRLKLGILIGGLVLVFGFIIFQVVSASGGGAAPAPIPVATAAPTTPNLTPEAPKEELIELPTLFASHSVDPFRTVLQPKITPPPRSAPRKSVMRNAQNDISKIGTFRPLEGIDGMGLAPSQDAVHLDGVIVGSNNVAVVRVGQESYVLNEGDSFGNDLKVKKITETHIIVGNGKEQKKVLLAGSGTP